MNRYYIIPYGNVSRITVKKYLKWEKSNLKLPKALDVLNREAGLKDDKS